MVGTRKMLCLIEARNYNAKHDLRVKWQRHSETWSKATTATSLVETLWLDTIETSLQRSCANREHVPLRRIGKVPPSRHWVFY